MKSKGFKIVSSTKPYFSSTFCDFKRKNSRLSVSVSFFVQVMYTRSPVMISLLSKWWRNKFQLPARVLCEIDLCHTRLTDYCFLVHACYVFLKKWATRPFFVYFRLFKQTLQNFTSNICEKCPSSIQYRDLNPQPSVHESSPITTRPGLPPLSMHVTL